MVDLLFERILVGRNYCIQTNLQATGIPDHLSIAHEVKCLRESVKKFEVQTIPSLREDIISKINEVTHKDVCLQF